MTNRSTIRRAPVLGLLVPLLLSTSAWSGASDRTRGTPTIQKGVQTTLPKQTIQKIPAKRAKPKPDMTLLPKTTIKMPPKQPSLLEWIKGLGSSALWRIQGGFYVCGNGEVEGSEECDDGNTDNGDGCSCSCYLEPVSGGVCGDGICTVWEMEAVFVPGSEELLPRCGDDCESRHNRPKHAVICGNCIIDAAGEECDDGNRIDWDDCSNACRISEEERDRRLCELPSWTEPSPDVIFQEYDTVRYISRCEDTDTTRYIVCGAEEARTVNLIDCTGCTRCSGGACQEVAPFPVSCVEESDAEDDPYILGLTAVTMCNRGMRFLHYDRCEGRTTVTQFYCTPAHTIELRSVPCPGGRRCSGGRCDRPPGPPPPPITWSCDSTDRDRDLYVRGTVTASSSDGRTESGSDRCLVGACDRSYVQEIICLSNGRTRWDVARCPSGEYCADGICVGGDSIPSCSDSDPTNNSFVRGTVTYRRASDDEVITLDDGCSNIHRDYQYECEPDGRANCFPVGLDCPASTHCNGGACVVSTCTDTDPADDTHIRGELTTNNLRNGAQDSCFGSGRVSEVYCTESHRGAERPISCDPTEHCADGVCVPGAPGLCDSCRLTAPTESHAGFVTGIDCFVQDDICRGQTLIRFRCNADGTPEEDPGAETPCTFGCQDGLCCTLEEPCCTLEEPCL